MEHNIKFLKFIVFFIPLIDCLSMFTDFPHSGQKSVSSSISVLQNAQYSFSPSSVFEVVSLISSLGSSFSSSVSFLSDSSSCEASVLCFLLCHLRYLLSRFIFFVAVFAFFFVVFGIFFINFFVLFFL